MSRPIPLPVPVLVPMGVGAETYHRELLAGLPACPAVADDGWSPVNAEWAKGQGVSPCGHGACFPANDWRTA